MIYLGSARHDENGNYVNGKSGDNDGTEVSTQPFYVHSKGWRVIRAKDIDISERIRYAMISACDNNNIGYDQNNRDSLYIASKPYQFDPMRVKEKVETDCSALVRVCCNYAGIKVGDFYTGNAEAVLEATGYFEPAFDYTDNTPIYNGDILCTKTKGHIVVVVNGSIRPNKKSYVLGWHRDHIGWWYADSESSYLKNEFKIINGHKYFFDFDGYIVTGYNMIDGNRYYFETSGDLMGAMMCTDINGCLKHMEF